MKNKFRWQLKMLKLCRQNVTYVGPRDRRNRLLDPCTFAADPQVLAPAVGSFPQAICETFRAFESPRYLTNQQRHGLHQFEVFESLKT